MSKRGDIVDGSQATGFQDGLAPAGIRKARHAGGSRLGNCCHTIGASCHRTECDPARYSRRGIP